MELNLTCTHCGEQCEIWEEVSTGFGQPDEIWCYCKDCDLETFHASPWYKEDIDN